MKSDRLLDSRAPLGYVGRPMSISKSRPAKLPAPAEDRLATLTRAISEILSVLTPEEREKVVRAIEPAAVQKRPTRGGAVTGTVVRLLPRKPEWSVEDIRETVEAEGIESTPKQIYNAMTYLARIGQVKRVGYGRYLVAGGLMDGAPDLGLPPAPMEGD